MKVLVESTRDVFDLQIGSDIVSVRLWEGETESGVPVKLFVVRVAVPAGADQTEFERELIQAEAPVL